LDSQLRLRDNRNRSQARMLRKFGFRLGRGGVHIGRTIMLEDIRTLFSYVKDQDSQKIDYANAIVNENCLGKRSERNRKLSSRHLMTLYSLEPSAATFRALRYFWVRDVEAQPLLALLCAYSRDALLRMGIPFVLSLAEGDVVDRAVFREFISKRAPGRFSESCLESLVRNLCGTLARSGHLEKAVKIRKRAKATAGSVSYALFLGYLLRSRGEALFSTEFMRVVDCSAAYSIELAEEASRRGWIIFNHIGKVMEAQFPRLLTTEEKLQIHRQK